VAMRAAGRHRSGATPARNAGPPAGAPSSVFSTRRVLAPACASTRSTKCGAVNAGGVGEPGVGRSSLLESAKTHAAGRHLRVLTTTGVQLK
jgi:hypothetical protein